MLRERGAKIESQSLQSGYIIIISYHLKKDNQERWERFRARSISHFPSPHYLAVTQNCDEFAHHEFHQVVQHVLRKYVETRALTLRGRMRHLGVSALQVALQMDEQQCVHRMTHLYGKLEVLLRGPPDSAGSVRNTTRQPTVRTVPAVVYTEGLRPLRQWEK